MTTSIKRTLPLLAVGVLAALPAAAQGAIVSNSAVASGAATGAAVNAPPLVTVGKSATSRDDAKVTALNVAGIELLGHQNGRYRGALAGLGGTIDGVNAATCPRGFHNEEGGSCLAVLHMETHEGITDGGGNANRAEVVVVGYRNNRQHLNVAGSSAGSSQNSIFCSDEASGYLVDTTYVSGLRNNATLYTQKSQSGACFTGLP